MRRTHIFGSASLVSLGIACYHGLGVFYGIDSSPSWRHAIFFGVCIFCAYGFVKRPFFFLFVFLPLVVQQYASHGGYLVDQWITYHQVDWISLVLLTLYPPLAVLLFKDYREKLVRHRQNPE